MTSKEYRDAFVAVHNSGTIAAQISAMRRALGWTQAELAARCGMKQPRISALEDPDFDNVEIATLQRIASAYDVGLVVSFVPFSEIAHRATNLNNSDFNVTKFICDSIDRRAAAKSLPFNITFNFHNRSEALTDTIVIEDYRSEKIPTFIAPPSLPISQEHAH